MGVYIKGMDMPRTGQVYTFEVVKHDEVPYMRIRVGFEVVAGVCGVRLEEKWEEYPLVEAKAPHGRLIDADALLRYKGDCYDADGHLLYAVGTGNIMCASTIIEAEGNDG